MEFHLTPTCGNDENDVEMLLPGIEVRVGVVEEVGVRLRDGMDGLTHQLDFFLWHQPEDPKNIEVDLVREHLWTWGPSGHGGKLFFPFW